MRMKKGLKNTTSGKDRYGNKKNKKMKLTLMCACALGCVKLYTCVSLCVIPTLYSVIVNWDSTQINQNIISNTDITAKCFFLNCNDIINAVKVLRAQAESLCLNTR